MTVEAELSSCVVWRKTVVLLVDTFKKFKDKLVNILSELKILTLMDFHVVLGIHFKVIKAALTSNIKKIGKKIAAHLLRKPSDLHQYKFSGRINVCKKKKKSPWYSVEKTTRKG